MARVFLSALLIFLFINAGCESISKSRRMKYVSYHPELSTEQKSLLLKGKLWVGMTKDEVTASLGNPDNIQNDKLGENEVWSYQYKGQYTNYFPYDFNKVLSLQFLEGRLANWREE